MAERAGSTPFLFAIPRDTAPTPCRGCGRPVYWIRTKNNKAMPVDTRVDGGLEPMRDRDGRGLSHFATCPKADQFRKKKIGAGGRGDAR